MAGAGGGTEEDSPHMQQLRAAMHLAVGRICDDVGTERGTPFERSTVAAITEAVLAQSAVIARDLELFAQHARRTAICPEDVKLTARRSPGLAAQLQREARRLAAEAGAARERRKAQRGKRGARGAGRGRGAADGTDRASSTDRAGGDGGDVMQLD